MTDDARRTRRDRVLRERAERLARAERIEERRLPVFRVAVVLVGEEQVGIPVEHLRELLRVPPITPLPGLPGWLVGVAPVRGEVISVLDLARWLGARGGGRSSCLALLEGAPGLLGVLADLSVGFRDIHDEDLVHDSAAVEEARRGAILGMTRDLCAILDVPGLFADPRLLVGGAPATPALVASGAAGRR